MAPSTVKWSIEDYHPMIKTGLLDNRPVELLAGEIVEMSPEGEVIEYANTSLDKDSTVKYHIYAEARILEYWLVNLQTGELIVYRQPSGREYGSKMTLKEGNISPVTFPDVTIPIEAIISA